MKVCPPCLCNIVSEKVTYEVAFIFHIALFADISKFFRRKFWWFRKDCVLLQASIG